MTQSLQVVVDLGEGLRPKETVVRAHRARVGAFDDGVFVRVDEMDFLARVATPKDEHSGGLPRVQKLDDTVREDLPPAARVTSRLPRTHRQHRVEHEHAPLSPGQKVAVANLPAAHVLFELFEDVLQAWWGR